MLFHEKNTYVTETIVWGGKKKHAHRLTPSRRFFVCSFLRLNDSKQQGDGRFRWTSDTQARRLSGLRPEKAEWQTTQDDGEKGPFSDSTKMEPRGTPKQHFSRAPPPQPPKGTFASQPRFIAARYRQRKKTGSYQEFALLLPLGALSIGVPVGIGHHVDQFPLGAAGLRPVLERLDQLLLLAALPVFLNQTPLGHPLGVVQHHCRKRERTLCVQMRGHEHAKKYSGAQNFITCVPTGVCILTTGGSIIHT